MKRTKESNPTRMLAGVLVLVAIVVITALIAGAWWLV